MCIYTYICLYIHMRVCVCVFAICICADVYVHIYIYMHTYIHVCFGGLSLRSLAFSPPLGGYTAKGSDCRWVAKSSHSTLFTGKRGKLVGLRQRM